MSTAAEIRSAAQSFVDATAAADAAQVTFNGVEAQALALVQLEVAALEAAQAAFNTAIDEARSTLPAWEAAQQALQAAQTARGAAAQAVYQLSPFDGT